VLCNASMQRRKKQAKENACNSAGGWRNLHRESGSLVAQWRHAAPWMDDSSQRRESINVSGHALKTESDSAASYGNAKAWRLGETGARSSSIERKLSINIWGSGGMAMTELSGREGGPWRRDRRAKKNGIIARNKHHLGENVANNGCARYQHGAVRTKMMVMRRWHRHLARGARMAAACCSIGHQPLAHAITAASAWRWRLEKSHRL